MQFKAHQRIVLCAVLAIIIVSIGRLEGAATGLNDTHYLSNHYSFAYELAGSDWSKPEQWTTQWPFNLEVPHKYRLLGNLPVNLSTKITRSFFKSDISALYLNYTLWTFIFLSSYLFLASRFTVEFLLLTERPLIKKHEDAVFLVSAMFFAVLPPIAFAFKFPVHSGPNDFLGYSLIAASLLALLWDKRKYFLLIVCLGVFCRETVLVVLIPFLLSAHPLKIRLVFSLIPVVLLFFYRIAWPGTYNPLGGSGHNFDYPLESLAFFFLTFSFMWPVSILGYLDMRKVKTMHPFIDLMMKSYIPILLVVTLIVLTLARVREIRIEYILFFIIVPYAIFYFLERAEFYRGFILSFLSIIAGVIAAIVTLYTYNYLTPVTEEAHKLLDNSLGGFYSGFGGGWKQVTLIHVALSTYILCSMFVSSRRTPLG